MGMSADEQTGLCGQDDLLRTRIVTARITANVRHINPKTFTRPIQVFGKLGANLRTIDISIYATSGFELAQPLQDFHYAKVAGVPYLIALREILEQGLVKEAVSI